MPISVDEMGIIFIFDGHLNPNQSIHLIMMII